MVMYGAMYPLQAREFRRVPLQSREVVEKFRWMFLPVYTMGVLALWCLRVSSWEDRALKGNAGHCNNPQRKSARKTGAGTK